LHLCKLIENPPQCTTLKIGSISVAQWFIRELDAVSPLCRHQQTK
jgi:hypothetical protein